MRPNFKTNQQSSVTRFALGQTSITPGAEDVLMIAGQTGIEFLRRHMSGDGSELTDDDARARAFIAGGLSRVERLRHSQRPGALDHYRSRPQLNDDPSPIRILRHKSDPSGSSAAG